MSEAGIPVARFHRLLSELQKAPDQELLSDIIMRGRSEARAFLLRFEEAARPLCEVMSTKTGFGETIVFDEDHEAWSIAAGKYYVNASGKIWARWVSGNQAVLVPESELLNELAPAPIVAQEIVNAFLQNVEGRLQELNKQYSWAVERRDLFMKMGATFEDSPKQA